MNSLLCVLTFFACSVLASYQDEPVVVSVENYESFSRNSEGAAKTTKIRVQYLGEGGIVLAKAFDLRREQLELVAGESPDLQEEHLFAEISELQRMEMAEIEERRDRSIEELVRREFRASWTDGVPEILKLRLLSIVDASSKEADKVLLPQQVNAMKMLRFRKNFSYDACSAVTQASIAKELQLSPAQIKEIENLGKQFSESVSTAKALAEEQKAKILEAKVEDVLRLFNGEQKMELESLLRNE